MRQSFTGAKGRAAKLRTGGIYRHTFYSVCTMHDACAFTCTQPVYIHASVHVPHIHNYTYTHIHTRNHRIVRAVAALIGCAACPNLTYPYPVAVSLQSAISYPLHCQQSPSHRRTVGQRERAAATLCARSRERNARRASTPFPACSPICLASRPVVVLT